MTKKIFTVEDATHICPTIGNAYILETTDGDEITFHDCNIRVFDYFGVSECVDVEEFADRVVIHGKGRYPVTLDKLEFNKKKI